MHRFLYFEFKRSNLNNKNFIFYNFLKVIKIQFRNINSLIYLREKF